MIAACSPASSPHVSTAGVTGAHCREGGAQPIDVQPPAHRQHASLPGEALTPTTTSEIMAADPDLRHQSNKLRVLHCRFEHAGQILFPAGSRGQPRWSRSWR